MVAGDNHANNAKCNVSRVVLNIIDVSEVDNERRTRAAERGYQRI